MAMTIIQMVRMITMVRIKEQAILKEDIMETANQAQLISIKLDQSTLTPAQKVIIQTKLNKYWKIKTNPFE